MKIEDKKSFLQTLVGRQINLSCSKKVDRQTISQTDRLGNQTDGQAVRQAAADDLLTRPVRRGQGSIFPRETWGD